MRIKRRIQGRKPQIGDTRSADSPPVRFVVGKEVFFGLLADLPDALERASAGNEVKKTS